MSIFRCNKCGKITEYERELVGTYESCGQCGTSTLIYDIVYFVRKLSDMYFAQRKELNQFREISSESSQLSTQPIISEKFCESFVIHNSDLLSSEAQHRPIIEWFRKKNITASANVDAVDTTGFFDEAAVAIGSDYLLLGEICERVRYAQQKEYNTASIQLSKRSKQDTKVIESFVKRLYDHSLVARFFDNKDEGSIRLVLQNAPSVRRFFADEWLEWYVLMIGLRIC